MNKSGDPSSRMNALINEPARNSNKRDSGLVMTSIEIGENYKNSMNFNMNTGYGQNQIEQIRLQRLANLNLFKNFSLRKVLYTWKQSTN
jgi:hypothetical protein